MHPSNTPTDFVLLNPHGGREIDPCRFAIITLSTDWLALLRQRITDFRSCQSDGRFTYGTFHDQNVAFFIDEYLSGRRNTIHYKKSSFKSWGIVELEARFMSGFIAADDARYTDVILRIDAAAHGQFSAKSAYFGHSYSSD